MKKLFYLITCFIFLSAFSGCAKTTDNETNNQSKTETTAQAESSSTTTAAPVEEIKTSKVL